MSLRAIAIRGCAPLFCGLMLLAGCGGSDQPEGLTGNPEEEEEEGYIYGPDDVRPPGKAANNSAGNTSAGSTSSGQTAAGNGTAAPPLPPITNPGGTTANTATTNTTPPPPITPAVALEESATDRAAADWVLKTGGRVAIDPTKPAAFVRSGGTIPASPFRVLRVDLHDCGLDNQSLAALSALAQLTELDLSETALGDAQLAEIKEAPALVTINIADTNVTDIGAKHLQTFPALKKIELPSGVSDAVIAELQAALPGCAVSK